MPQVIGERERAVRLLKRGRIVRMSELREAGVSATTVGRMERDGMITRLSRGLYQSPDAPLHEHHTLAEAAKRAPKGVVCLISALAFHGLTDQLPSEVWMAFPRDEWKPSRGYPPIRASVFASSLLKDGVEHHWIEGVRVNVFNVAKTVVDCFRHRRSVGKSVAIEGLQEALRLRKTSPSELYEYAHRGGMESVMRPYLEALTANG